MTRPSAAECLQVLALFNLAVAYPLLDLLVRAPVLVMASGMRPAEAALLVAIPCLLLPLGVLLMEAAVGRLLPAVAPLLHAFVVAQLCGLLVMRALRGQLPHQPAWAVAGLLAAVLLTWPAYLRWRWARSFLTALAPAVLVVPAVVLLSPPFQEVLRQPARSPAASPQGGRFPVIVLLFDELPLVSLLDEKGGIDARRFPSFAALVRRSTWYRNASTVAGETREVLPSLLTGCYPDTPGAANGNDGASRAQLFSLLGQTHRITAFEVATRAAPPPLDMVRGGGLQASMDRVASLLARLAAADGAWLSDEAPGSAPSEALRNEAKAASDDVWASIQGDENERFQAFLASLGTGQPTVYFYHSMLPHAPWDWLPSGRRYPTSLMLPDEEWPDAQWMVDYGRQRHLLQVACADRMLGAVMERLRQQRLLDGALLLVLSDHGLGFQPGQDSRDPAPEAVADVAAIPFFLKLPGQRQAAVSDRNVEIVDIAPTLAAAVGTPLSWTVDGSSLLDRDPARPVKRFKGRDPLPARLSLEASTWRRQVALFGGGGFDRRFYSLGPCPDIVGRPARALAAPAEGPLRRSWLQRPSEYAEVRADATDVPACVEGRVELPPGRGMPLAVAISLNGRIEAAAHPIAISARECGFSAMVREDALRPGANDVQIYAVERQGSARVLHPTRRQE